MHITAQALLCKVVRQVMHALPVAVRYVLSGWVRYFQEHQLLAPTANVRTVTVRSDKKK